MIASIKKKRTSRMRSRTTSLNASRRHSALWRPPVLTFTPYAWSKLQYLRDLGPTEVGGFGIAAADDLLRVEDIQLVGQSCTSVSVEFSDESVADFFDQQVDEGRSPEQFARIWIHTHPGSSPLPSITDEETFQRCFSEVDWAVMFILARGGKSYARMRINVGPVTQQRIGCRTDFGAAFPASDHDIWYDEYAENVEELDQLQTRSSLWPDLDEHSWWGDRGRSLPVGHESLPEELQ